MDKPRLLRITTVPISLHLLLRGQFRFMSSAGFEVLTASADGPEIADVRKEGVEHVIIPFTRKITPLTDLVCLWRLTRLMRKFRPRIVHTHTPKAGLLGMLAAWVAGVPVRLHTVAGLPFMEAQGGKGALLRVIEKITYRFAHRVYPNSEGLLVHMRKRLGVGGAKFRVIGKGSSNGIDLSFFSRTPDLVAAARDVRKAHSLLEDEFVFCFVGRIVRDKGVMELVDAFEQVAASRPSKLLLVGPFETELDPLPERTVRFLKEDPRVVLAGFQDDVRPWLIAADAFVLPSYREGFPNVVMQASALEVPSIVSDINGCNELIRPGGGIIVPPKNAVTLASAMVELMNDPNRVVMGRAARALMVSDFDQQIFWRELLAEYRSLIA